MTGPPSGMESTVISQLLRSALGHLGDLTAMRVIQADTDYAVIAATLANPAQEVVVKLAGPRAALACPFEQTAAIVGLVRSRTAAPTFDVLAVDVSYRLWPWRYIVLSAVPGAQWSSVRPALAGDPHELYAQLGRIVAQLHTLHFPSCGEIGADGRVVTGTTYHTALLARARRRIANPAHAALFIALLRERADLFAGLDSGTLCHEDLNPHNILVDHAAGCRPVVSVVDFDSAWAGSPESDLARLELWRGMIGDGFWDAYRAIAPVDPRYRERRPILQLLWCLEYAQPTPEHHADTARVCAELGIAPVTFPTASEEH